MLRQSEMFQVSRIQEFVSLSKSEPKQCIVVLLGWVISPKVSRNRGTPSVSVGLRSRRTTGRLLVLQLHLRLVVVGLGLGTVGE